MVTGGDLLIHSFENSCFGLKQRRLDAFRRRENQGTQTKLVDYQGTAYINTSRAGRSSIGEVMKSTNGLIPIQKKMQIKECTHVQFFKMEDCFLAWSKIET